jgi:hypothetical protein
MKHKKHLLITLIGTLIMLMAVPNYAMAQKNYCKGSCDDKKFFGKIGCWIAKSWKQGYKKREDACFGRYDPANFDPSVPKRRAELV